MTALFARAALLPDGWAERVRIEFDGGGILSVEAEAAPLDKDERCAVLLPGMPNLHSHAFQRGMAGLAERRGPESDNFWSWREAMYHFALRMDPDQAEAIAELLYIEMLERGFTRVGEFHYLHHDRNGGPYADLGEMAGRMLAAARTSGIGITLLPVFYAHSTFGGAPPSPGQRRFINDVNRFAQLADRCGELVAALNQGLDDAHKAVLGVAPHSLRAVTPDELREIAVLAGSGPLHIHAGEQVKEVEDCLAWSGMRPVEWLLAHASLDERWCLIHATHMTAEETAALAASGAVAGLCPVTEANLGDGVFPADAFLAAGGRFGIGTDSNILIGVADELRQLEYAQRLSKRQRNVLAGPGGSTGRLLFERAVAGGAQALGASPAAIEPGCPADLVSLDTGHPTLAGRRGDALLDAWIFAGAAAVDRVWAGGRQLVSGGRHHGRDAAEARFRKAMRELLDGSMWTAS